MGSLPARECIESVSPTILRRTNHSHEEERNIMIKQLLAVLALTFAGSAFAAAEVNKATAAELDGIKGIGPALSGRILDERKKGAFKDWNDLMARVKGVKEGAAAKYSKEGLTVNGEAFKKTAATGDKPAATEKAAAKK
jgi:competence protein ComEA